MLLCTESKCLRYAGVAENVRVSEFAHRSEAIRVAVGRLESACDTSGGGGRRVRRASRAKHRTSVRERRGPRHELRLHAELAILSSGVRVSVSQ